MPKTNDATGATYLGHEGIVEHAGGAGSTRPGGLSEVDVSRDLDGTVVDGYESDEREVEDREGAHLAEPTILPQEQEKPETEAPPQEETKEKEEEHPSTPATVFGQEEKDTEKSEEVATSPGSSSAASSSSNKRTTGKAANPR